MARSGINELPLAGQYRIKRETRQRKSTASWTHHQSYGEVAGTGKAGDGETTVSFLTRVLATRRSRSANCNRNEPPNTPVATYSLPPGLESRDL